MQTDYGVVVNPQGIVQYQDVVMKVGGNGGYKRVKKMPRAAMKPSKKRRVQNRRPRPENTHTGRWTKEEHAKFLDGIKLYGKEWKKIAGMIETRTVVQIRTHAQKYFQKLAKKKAQEGQGGNDASLKSVAAKKKGGRREAGRGSAGSGKQNSPTLSLLLPQPADRAKAKPARESPTSVADLSFHFPKLGANGSYPESASNLFSGDLAVEPDVPLTNWLNDVNVKQDSDSSDCCSFLTPAQPTIYADTNAKTWDDPWDFDPSAFATGSLLVGDTL